MGSGSTPPAYPGLSYQERALLEKQGLTLDQFNNILSQENINAQENQNLLRQLSGLYTEEDVAANPGTPALTGRTQSALEEIANKGLNGVPVEAIVGFWGEAKGLSSDAMSVAKTLASRDGGRKMHEWAADLTSNPSGAISLGLGEMRGATEASKKWTLNQTAIDDLRKRVAAGQATQQELTDLEQGIYKSGLESLKAQLPQITELNQLQLERQKRALEGTLPVSQGLMDRKAEDFIHLREAAARRGIFIEGDDPGTATSQSSAGNELVGQFKRTYGLLEDQERRGEITGAPQQVYTPGPASSTPAYGQQLSFATAPGSGGLLGAYGQLAGMYGAATGPYANAAANSYQGVLNSYMQNQANRRSGFQMGGQVIGGLLGGIYGGPAGAAGGSQVGGYAGSNLA